jgi:hypothetical protein
MALTLLAAARRTSCGPPPELVVLMMVPSGWVTVVVVDMSGCAVERGVRVEMSVSFTAAGRPGHTRLEK